MLDKIFLARIYFIGVLQEMYLNNELAVRRDVSNSHFCSKVKAAQGIFFADHVNFACIYPITHAILFLSVNSFSV